MSGVQETAASAPPSGQGAARAGLRWDPWVVVVGVVSLVVFVLQGFTEPLNRDLGLFLYDAQQVLAGTPPYVAQMNTVGPLSDLVPALFIGLGRVFGLGDVFAARLGFAFLSAALCALLYLLGRDVFRSRGAGLVSVATMLTFHEFAELGANGPREKTAMLLFLLGSLYALCHRRWAISGALIALATLTWQPSFFVGVAAAAVVLATHRAGRWPAALRYLGGGAVTAAAFVVYFVAVGALRPFLDGFVVINARYVTQESVLTTPAYIRRLLVDHYGWSLALAGVGMVLSLVLAVLAVRSSTTRHATDATDDAPMVMALGAVTLGGVLWAMEAFNGGPDLFPLLPTAALGVGGLVPHVRRAVTPRRTTVVVAVWSAACLVWATTYALSSGQQLLLRQRASVGAVLRNAPAGATVLSVEAPGALVLAHRTNLTDQQLFMTGMANYLDHTYPGGLTGYGRRVGQDHPTVIVVRTGKSFPWLKPTLAEYRKLPGPKWSYYVAKSVPQATFLRMRAANLRAMRKP